MSCIEYEVLTVLIVETAASCVETHSSLIGVCEYFGGAGTLWTAWCSGYSAWLWAGQSGGRILVGERFSAHVQTGPVAHPASCTLGTGSFPGVKSGRGMTLTPHSFLVLWSIKSRAITLLPLWTIWPVQNLSACTVYL